MKIFACAVVLAAASGCVSQSVGPNGVHQKAGPFEQSVGPGGVEQKAGPYEQTVDSDGVKQGTK